MKTFSRIITGLPKKYLMLVIIYVNLNGLQGLRCLSCSDALSPTECDTVKLCGPHEICFVDKVMMADSGLIRYHLGCRDSQQCSRQIGRRHVLSDSHLNKSKNNSGFTDHLRHANHRRSLALPLCSECCSSTVCNSAGCGHAGYMPHHGPVCFNCILQSSPDDCDRITVCGQHQVNDYETVCKLTRTINSVTHHVLYSTKCEDEKVCAALENSFTSVIGKRQIEGRNCGVHCCNADLCNLGCNATSTSSGP